MTIHEAAVAFRILTSRSVLTGPDGVEGIDTRALDPGAIVLGAGSLYQFDPTSVAVVDGVTVLETNGPLGRWIYLAGSSAAITTVPDITTLALLSSGSPDLIWVDTVTCFWRRVLTSTLAPDGITVVAAIGGGRWERLVTTTALDWLVQAAWTIDPILGDDENAGGALAPLATFAELDRRWSVGALRQNTTVTVVAGAVLPQSRLSVDLGVARLSIVGVATLIAAGTLATYSDRVHATPVESLITDAGIADWTPYVNARLRLTSGAANNLDSLAWVARADPGGAGLNVAAISRWARVPSASNFVGAANPSVGNTYSIESLPRIVGVFHLIIRDRIAVVDAPSFGAASNLVTVSGLVFESVVNQSSQVMVENHHLNQVQFDGCAIESSVNWQGGDRYPSHRVIRSRMGGGTAVAPLQCFGAGSFNFCLFKTEIWPGSAATLSLASSLFSSAGLATAASIDPGLRVVMSDVQVFDCTTGQGVGIMLIRPIIMIASSGLSGARNTIGMLLGDPDNEACGEISVCFPQSTDLPNLLGTTTPIRVAGLTNIDLAWAATPFDSDAQAGVASLIDGIATVTARNANVRAPMVVRESVVGTPFGQLVVAPGTRLAGSFVVESLLPADGTRVITDDGAFRWEIPPMARKIRIYQGTSITGGA